MLWEDLKDTRYAEDLKIMIGETERCRIIVRGLLDFARETHMEKRPCDMNRIIGETLFILEKSDGLRGIRVEKDLDPDIPEISMDAGQMKSVISNLVINALDAMPEEAGLLRISTRHASDPERVIIEVRDNGSGIKKEHLPLIFDPFFHHKETGRGPAWGFPSRSALWNAMAEPSGSPAKREPGPPSS
jgi:two-component system NtrC family sensor kinase